MMSYYTIKESNSHQRWYPYLCQLEKVIETVAPFLRSERVKMSDHPLYNKNMSNKNVFGDMLKRRMYNINMSKKNVFGVMSERYM